MKYIPAREAAAKWHVNVRVAQSYCKDGRIPGAKKYGNSWMIPADAEKPMDRRKTETEPQSVASPYLSCVLLSAVIPMPRSDPDLALSALADEAQRAQYRAELAYLRGDYDAVKAYYSGVHTGESTYLCAANIAICAAMCTRDHPLFKEISASVLKIEMHSPWPDARRAASMLTALAAVCMNAPRMAPAWLINGEFDGFSADSRPMLIFMRIKYLQSVKDNAGLLAAAQTALEIYRRGDATTLVDIYLTCLCACGCYALGRLDDTRQYLAKSVAMCEKGGFVSPLGEYATWVGGLLGIALKKAAPAFEMAVQKHIETTLKNWLFFHNEFARDNASLILTTTEYQLALLLKEGKTYAQAAERLCISVGRVKNLISVVYEKLGISKKADVAHYVF